MITRLGLWSYEVVPNQDGKKLHLGKFKSKLQAALVFYRYMQVRGPLPVLPCCPFPVLPSVSCHLHRLRP